MAEKTGQQVQAAGRSQADQTADQQEDLTWPVDQEGDPMAKISFQATELVGLRDYSNIVVGPARVEAFVSLNTPNPFSDKQLKNLASGLNDLARTVEEDVVATQREVALGTIDPSKVHG